MNEFHPTPLEQEQPPELYGRTASEWHAFLTGDNLDVPCSRYGRNAASCAWWAVASLIIMNTYGAVEEPDAGAYAEYVMGLFVNNDEMIGALVLEERECVPRSIADNLIIEGGDA